MPFFAVTRKAKLLILVQQMKMKEFAEDASVYSAKKGLQLMK